MEGLSVMNRQKRFWVFLVLMLIRAGWVWAASDSEAQLGQFLNGIGDFLIRIIGPGVLVIGVCIGGISMATGNEDGLRRGIFAALGGAFIMMSRAILDLIQRLTGF
jgi:type IV secretory pathway VirB2 component (pilin)